MSAPTLAPAAACYYLLDGIPRGPVSEEELDAMHAAGTVDDRTQVRTPRAADWQTCEQWRELRARPPEALPAPGDPEARPEETDPKKTEPRHTCTACRKEWPESLMLMDARKWLCRSCFYKMAMNARRDREKGRRDWWKTLRTYWKRVSLLILGLSAAGFLAWHYRRHLPFDFFDEEDPAEAWASLPPAQWPALTFTNRADFHGHSTLSGQGVFFALRGDGVVVAATAAHLLTADAGVVPDMVPSELESALRAWWAYPPGAPAQAVTLAGLSVPPAALRGFDVLFLKVAPNSANTSGITPLRLARREAHAGEKVFVVAPAVSLDPKAAGARQAVFPGWIHVKTGVAAKDGTLLDVHMDPTLVPKDLGGSPVIDERGHLVGLVKGWGDPQDAAGHVNTIVAQGSVAFRNLLEPKPEASKAGGQNQVAGMAAKVEKEMRDLLSK